MRKTKKLFNLRIVLTLICAAFVIVLSGSLYFIFKPENSEPPISYLDDNIIVSTSQLEDFTSIDNIYIPNLDILSIQSIKVGTHIETKNPVYFTLIALYEDEISYREIEMVVVLEKDYSGIRVVDFTNLSNQINIENKTVKFRSVDYDGLFYTYYLGYTDGNIRYYFNYKTIEENDIVDFFGQLLN